MVRQKLRKVRNSYVVTIPVAEVRRLRLEVGELLDVDIRPLGRIPPLRPEVQEAFEASWQQHEAVYRYLADR